MPPVDASLSCNPIDQEDVWRADDGPWWKQFSSVQIQVLESGAQAWTIGTCYLKYDLQCVVLCKACPVQAGLGYWEGCNAISVRAVPETENNHKEKPVRRSTSNAAVDSAVLSVTSLYTRRMVSKMKFNNASSRLDSVGQIHLAFGFISLNSTPLVCLRLLRESRPPCAHHGSCTIYKLCSTKTFLRFMNGKWLINHDTMNVPHLAIAAN